MLGIDSAALFVYNEGMSSTYKAPAKINLSLRVKGKREDGFHEVDILMAALDLCDELEFHNSRTTTLLCDTPGLPLDETNLVMRAVRAFEKVYGRKAKQRITITKRIPMQAGLGGGSSDAATTLLALNEVLGTNFSTEELREMAAELGSDVAYFLTPGICRCTGKGELVTPMPELAEWTSPIVLLKPSFGVSTPTAYRLLESAKPLPGIPYEPQKVDGVVLENHLEKPVFSKYPYLGLLKRWALQQEGVRAAMMSGSGSTIFALTHTPEQAQALAQAAKEQVDATLTTFCGTVNPQ